MRNHKKRVVKTQTSPETFEFLKEESQEYVGRPQNPSPDISGKEELEEMPGIGGFCFSCCIKNMEETITGIIFYLGNPEDNYHDHDEVLSALRTMCENTLERLATLAKDT